VRRIARDKSRPRSPLRAAFDFDRRDNRQMECEYFESFRFLEQDVQGGQVAHDDRPDFRVSIGVRVIGVEITKLFKPMGRQDIESTQERILSFACAGAERIDLPAADVALFPNFREPLDAARCQKIADAVTRVVAANMPADGESIELEGQPWQPSEVDLISISRWNSRGSGRWHWVEAARIEKDVSGIVQGAIDKKTKLLPAYLGVCSECWLLLVSDGLRPSGKMEFGEHFQSQLFRSAFARTYVLDFGKGKLYQPQTASGSS
jgi:hypothetical protein